jgi:hypothetical protein
MEIPTIINVNMDVPVEFKAMADYQLYLMNFTYNVVTVMSVTMMEDGSKDYCHYNTFPIIEMKGGLAYYEFGWKIFPISVQEKYSEYVAEKEILNE